MCAPSDSNRHKLQVLHLLTAAETVAAPGRPHFASLPDAPGKHVGTNCSAIAACSVLNCILQPVIVRQNQPTAASLLQQRMLFRVCWACRIPGTLPMPESS